MIELIEHNSIFEVEHAKMPAIKTRNGSTPLSFDRFVRQFSGNVFLYGNASHAFKDILVRLARRHPRTKPNILMPAFIPAKLYRTVLAAGFTPKFYEVFGSCEYDPDEVDDLVDSNTLAMFLIHYFGFPGNVAHARSLAQKTGVCLIEDCAHSLLGTVNGQPVGTFGDYSIFSVRKMLVLPEGGFLAVNSHAENFSPSYEKRVNPGYTALHLLQSRLKHLYIATFGGATTLARLPQTGYINPEEKHHVTVKGMSWLTERYVRSVDIGNIASTRRENYRQILRGLEEVPYLTPLHGEFPGSCTPYSFPVIVKGGLRDTVRSVLRKAGIACGAGWPESPFHLPFRRTKELSGSFLELPVHHLMSPQQRDRMLEVLSLHARIITTY